MRTFHIPKNLDLTHLKGTIIKPFQMSPRFLVNVILCAQPPDSMTSFT